MAKPSKVVGTSAEAAAKRALAEHGRVVAQPEPSVELSFGEKISQALKKSADNIRNMSGTNAKKAADALEKLSQDEILEIAEPGSGTLDYLIAQVNANVEFHLRTTVISEVRKIREALDGVTGTDFTVQYG